MHTHLIAETCNWRLFDAGPVGVLGEALEKAVLDKNPGTNCVSNAFIALSQLGHEVRPRYRYLDLQENVVQLRAVPKGMIAVDRVSLMLPDLEIEHKDKIRLFPMIHSFLLLHSEKAFVICDAFETVRHLMCRLSSRSEVEKLNLAARAYLLHQNDYNYRHFLQFFLDKNELELFLALEKTSISDTEYKRLQTKKEVDFFRVLARKQPSEIEGYFSYLEEGGVTNTDLQENLGLAVLAKVPLIESVHVEISEDYHPVLSNSWWKKLLSVFSVN